MAVRQGKTKVPKGSKQRRKQDRNRHRQGGHTTAPIDEPRWKRIARRVEVRLGTASALLSIVAAITLQPQLALTPGEPIRQRQPFSVPFTITNTGVFAATDAQVRCYAHHINGPAGETHNWVMSSGAWTGGLLDSGESQASTCPFFVNPPPTDMDIAIIVDYKERLVPFWKFRRYFRFVASANTDFRWLAQPSTAIRGEADAAMRRDEEHLAKLPKEEREGGTSIRFQR